MRVVDIFSFALRIQAAGVNRRLKQDMADQDPELSPEDLKRMSFFEPEPSEEAMRVFQKYVDTKWPLRVYAIEPVIAQQNVADAFGRRKFSAIDLVGLGLRADRSRRSRESTHSDRPPMTRRPFA